MADINIHRKHALGLPKARKIAWQWAEDVETSLQMECTVIEGVTSDTIPESVRESVMMELRKSFRPEFLNRIDETILFKPLTLEEITTIVDLLLADLNKRLADRRVTVTLDKKAKEWAAEKGYDPVFGARPLKRFLQRNIETKLARALISGEVGEGGDVKFSVKDDGLVMK